MSVSCGRSRDRSSQHRFSLGFLLLSANVEMVSRRFQFAYFTLQIIKVSPLALKSRIWKTVKFLTLHLLLMKNPKFISKILNSTFTVNEKQKFNNAHLKPTFKILKLSFLLFSGSDLLLNWFSLHTRRPVRRADNLTTFMCQLSRNSGASTSWNLKGLSRPVMGKLYLLRNCTSSNSKGEKQKLVKITNWY
jgi:hypothetical protein